MSPSPNWLLIAYRIIMGLDRNQKYEASRVHQTDRRTPCGFAFVEYYLHNEAVASLRYLSGTKLDERVIRCDIDPGYQEGRQFGRGKSGGQVRDEFRQEYDSGRGMSPWLDTAHVVQVAGDINGLKRNNGVKIRIACGPKCSSIRMLRRLVGWGSPERMFPAARGRKQSDRRGRGVKMTRDVKMKMGRGSEEIATRSKVAVITLCI